MSSSSSSLSERKKPPPVVDSDAAVPTQSVPASAASEANKTKCVRKARAQAMPGYGVKVTDLKPDRMRRRGNGAPKPAARPRSAAKKARQGALVESSHSSGALGSDLVHGSASATPSTDQPQHQKCCSWRLGAHAAARPSRQRDIPRPQRPTSAPEVLFLATRRARSSPSKPPARHSPAARPVLRNR
jgi:hypothetical protein